MICRTLVVAASFIQASRCFSTLPMRSSTVNREGLEGRAVTRLGSTDTDEILPSFADKGEYTNYLKGAGQLPLGFAVGTASGTFISKEA